MVLYGSSFINLIFAPRGLAAALAHVGPHRVTGIALPPVDATFGVLFSIVSLAVSERTRENKIIVLLVCIVSLALLKLTRRCLSIVALAAAREHEG
jgi:hypothetical protein